MPAIRSDVSLLERIEAEAKAQIKEGLAEVPTCEEVLAEINEPREPAWKSLRIGADGVVYSVDEDVNEDVAADDYESGAGAPDNDEDRCACPDCNCDPCSCTEAVTEQQALIVESAPENEIPEPVPELEAEPEFDPENEAKETKKERPDQVFDLGTVVAKMWDPWTPAGKVDQVKAGAARVKLHESAAWHPNHRLVEALDPATRPEFSVGDAVSHIDESWEKLGEVAYFSSDGLTTYVNVTGLDENGAVAEDIVPRATKDLCLCDPERLDEAFDPLFDDAGTYCSSSSQSMSGSFSAG